MNVDASIRAINNILNSQTNNFQAGSVVQNEDKITISKEARIAAQNNAGENISTSNIAQDIVNMTANESYLAANVKTINAQDQIDQALFTLEK